MQKIENAVIAAAGMGSRIGLGMPKCMIEINGKTILTRLIETLHKHVSVIHLVVGYREEMVIEYCERNHRDIVLVRNPDFRTTNTAYSFWKGGQHIEGKVLYLDGDLLISPDSLTKFIKVAQEKDILVGYTDAKSENAVFVHGDMSGPNVEIVDFSREQKSNFEWGNVFSGPSDLMAEATGYVFERLTEHLPLTGCMLELAEVDTTEDLKEAQKFALKLDN
jgi:NDP-sugar pyrophosphorylase family protein